MYIVASWTRAIYTGVTNNVEVRLHQHRTANDDTFAGKYRACRLVYVEEYRWIQDAIAREKQIKGWRREREIALIESLNPDLEGPLQGLGVTSFGTQGTLSS